MSQLVFAAIADDDTGASDLAGMLAEQGVRTLLVIDLPDPTQFQAWSRDCQAVVLAEGTRNLDPATARERTVKALRLLQPQRPRVVQIKYCSTFDSTPAGNIGPTIEVALDELGEVFTIAVPALPVNGRTTRHGLHYVHGQLLSESPMRHHPLTPMTNANLVEWLQLQTRRKVGLASFEEVEAGAENLRRYFEQLRGQGVTIAIVDCLNDSHLETICQAAAGLRLVTGSSAFGIGMPAIWRANGWLAEPSTMFEPSGAPKETGCLIVAGSCSEATRGQNRAFVAQGGSAIQIDPREILAETLNLERLAEQSMNALRAGQDCLIFTSDVPEQVRLVQAWGAQQGMSIPVLGEAIATKMAGLALEILRDLLPRGLIVAGGETSGAICRRLELGAFRVGRNIEPGVPLCFSLGRFQLPVVLKSGNFGGEDFYARASRAIARPQDWFK